MMKTPELVAALSIIEHLEGVRDEMDTWSKVQNKILDVLATHTATLSGMADDIARLQDSLASSPAP